MRSSRIRISDALYRICKVYKFTSHLTINFYKRFIQKSKNAAGKEMEKKSTINIVDLAGSERADATGATGITLEKL